MRKLIVGIITEPISKSGCIPLSNLIAVIYPISDHSYLITGNEGYTLFKDDHRLFYVYGIRHKLGSNVFTRIIRYMSTQMRISYALVKFFNVDVWILFIGGESLLLPMFVAKCLRKKVVLLLAGFPARGRHVQKDPLSKPLEILSNINMFLSDGIVLYSKRIIIERELKRHENKCFVAHEHILDLNEFKLDKDYYERNNLIGYIGSLSELKGILNFTGAIPEIISKIDNSKIIIVGGGPLKDSLSAYIKDMGLNNKVKLCGWQPHDSLPSYMNELKILVLPSYTEGLPNVILEAMACGTPVLATPVGAIPDLIKDGETGFLMENNSPECIADNVIRALEHPDLEGVAERGRALVKREFTFEKAVERWRAILEEVGDVKTSNRDL